MTDEGRRKLTEYLDECWHKQGWPTMQMGCKAVTTRCKYCEEDYELSHFPRAFDTWDDLGALLTKLTASTKWWAFIDFAGKRQFAFDLIIDDFASGFTRWLLQDPSRFCRLVLEAIGQGVIK